jgi:hypothetical protein
MVRLQKLYENWREGQGQVQWLTLVIPTTQEAELWKSEVKGQPQQKVSEIPPQQTSQA